MARKLKKREKWERHTIGNIKRRETLNNFENDKWTLQDMDYGKKNEKRGKWKTHTIGPVIWRVKLKNVENEKCTL